MDETLFYSGVAIVGVSHLWMLLYPDRPLTTGSQHVWINLGAAALLLASVN